MADVFSLAGSTLDLNATDALPTHFRERFGTVPTLTIQRRGIQPPAESADTWMGKTLTWTLNGTLRFSGHIRSRSLHRDPNIGWVVTYQALGFRDQMDKFPLTDKTTGLDVSPFNCQPEDLINYSAARAGRTVGQILTDVLTSSTNAANMVAYGLGNYTVTGSPPVYALPTATVSDLAALTVIPPAPVYVTGEKFGDALAGLIQRCAPNVRMWVQPDGTLRFKDLTTFTASTLTMGSDPIEPTEISRDVADCWQRIQVRGAPIAVMFLLKLSQSTLTEDFAYGALDNAGAKSAWTTNSFKGTASTQDSGNCTMPSTTTITVTTSQTYVSNQWDQTSTGQKGSVNLYNTAVTGVTSCWTARIVSNTATSGGTSTVTIDAAAPNTSYNRFTITGQTTGASLVWRKYKIADSTLWPLIVAQSTYPQPFINPGGGATLTSTPIGAVLWPQSGSAPPYNMFPLPFVVDSSTGHIIFQAPTYVVANNAAPADVWAMLPINTGPNQVFSPQNSGGSPVYGGDSHTIEGLADTLVVTMPDWRDPGQLAQVQAYADDLLKSVKDGAREGSVLYHGLYEAALTFGMGLSIAGLKDDGTTDTTGWESANIPVVGVEIEWSQGADDYTTTIEVSSRRGHYSAEMFLRPERRFNAIGLSEGSDVFFAGNDSLYKAQVAGVDQMAKQAEQPYTDRANQVKEWTDQATHGQRPDMERPTDLGIPTIAPGYGGGGDLGIPSFQDYGMSFTPHGNNFANDGSLGSLPSKADHDPGDDA